MHVRLSFIADNCRIDRIRVSTGWRRPPARALSLLTGGKEYYIALANADGTTADSVSAALSRIASEAGPLVAKRLNGGHPITIATTP